MPNFSSSCLWAERRGWVIVRGGGGHRYICNRKDEIVHGLSPSVKCVDDIIHCLSPSVECFATLFRDMSLAKVRNSGGVARPPAPSP